jgi:hypothetical protein
MQETNAPNIRIDVWKVNSENPASPALNGYVTINGVKYPISMWDNSGAAHPKAPAFKGKLSRPSPKTAELPQAPEPVATSLPF